MADTNRFTQTLTLEPLVGLILTLRESCCHRVPQLQKTCASWVYEHKGSILYIRIEVNPAFEFDRILAYEATDVLVIVSGAVVIQPSFGVRFASGEVFAGLTYVTHEAQSKPAHAESAYVAPGTELCQLVTGAPPVFLT